MSFFLMPITLLIKHYFPFEHLYFAEIDLYLFLLLIVIDIVINRRKYLTNQRNIISGIFNQCLNLINKKVVIFFLIAFFIQCVAIMISHFQIKNNTHVFGSNPIVAIMAFLALSCVFFIHYFVVGLLVKSKREIARFINGLFWMTIILLAITYLQLIYLSFPNVWLNKLMLFFGKYFEQRNVYTPDWYVGGSYVTTIRRINGFFSEPAKLAAFLCIICLPFILASIKNKYNIFSYKNKYRPGMYYFLLGLILILLLLAKTTTGIIAIGLAIVTLWATLPRKRKLSLGVVSVLAVVVLIILYYTNSSINQVANEYIFHKSISSSNNRIGGTIGLIITLIHRPFLGVGQSYTNYYLNQFTPAWSIDNSEYKSFLLTRQSIPIFSNLFGWFIQYGLIVCTFAAVYIVRLKRSLTSLVKKIQNKSEYKFHKTINDSAFYFIFFFFTLSFLTFGWNESAFFIMFFFFIVYRQYLMRISKKTFEKDRGK